MHLILGHLAPDGLHVPDAGRPAGERRRARASASRGSSAPTPSSSAAAEIDAIAAYLHAEQVRQIEAAARRVSERAGRAAPVVPLGGGAFLAREAAAAPRLGPCVEMPWSAARARRGARRRARRAAADRAAVLTVVKVGGGLAREAGDDALRALCAAIGEAGRAPPAAGRARRRRVRRRRARPRPVASACATQTAHRMAILAMDQFGWAARRPDPGGAVRSSRRTCDAGAAGVAGPAAGGAAAERDPLPASWAVTSDSIAAWVAGAAGAARLVLVKPVAGLYATGRRTVRRPARLSVGELAELARQAEPRASTRTCPQALRAAGVETWVIDGRDPARLAELLDARQRRRDAA